MDQREPNQLSEAQMVAAYDAVNRHWAHAEQERWAILYNFLMASTILLLAWAAVFASQQSLLRRVVLVVLAVAGALVSLLWVTIGCRVNTFIRIYGELAEDVEARLGIGVVGPFHAGERLRLGEKQNPGGGTRMDQWGRRITSRHFVVLVPLVFASVYVVFILASVVP